MSAFYVHQCDFKDIKLEFESHGIQPLAVSANQIVKVENTCSFPVWVGILGNVGHSTPEEGGFRLSSSRTRLVRIPEDEWSGRFWGRTECDDSTGRFRCLTGDCGPHIQCSVRITLHHHLQTVLVYTPVLILDDRIPVDSPRQLWLN